MGKKAVHTDLYMNWFPLGILTNGVDSTILSEQQHNTGMSIRGGLLWLIHMIEWSFPRSTQITHALTVGISTVSGLGAMPALAAQGTIALLRHIQYLVTSGMSRWQQPDVQRWLPPMPLASSKISVYFISSIDDAAHRDWQLEGRIGFTTVPMEESLYVEIAETWGW
jgi:hypothetical protein